MINRKIQTLGLAFAAVLAMGAVIASAAQATTLTASNPTTGAHEHATISASQIGNHTFKFGIRESICSTAEFDGTLTGTDEALTVTPTYSGCSTKPILGVSFRITITHEGCTYVLHAFEPYPKLTTDIKCPEGKKVTMHLYNNADATHSSPVCTLTIGETGNQNLATIEMVNSAAGVNPMDVVLKTTEVPLTTDGTGGVCGGADQTLKLNGETTIKAFSTSAGNPQINLTAVNEA